MALQHIRVVEFAGLAPGPFAGLVLADWGADVIRVDRPAKSSPDTLCRNKRSIAIDVKVSSGLGILIRLVSQADVLIDPFRPGVMERLGLGPEVFLGEQGLNKKLIYARLAGFPTLGPHKDMAGHDINYLALSGVLSMLPGDPSKPAFPLNILADFAGGGLTCALGILLALIERQTSGIGQVVNTDMVSGTRYISSFPLMNAMKWSSSRLFSTMSFAPSPPPSSSQPTTRMSNLLDGGAPFYNIYTCADRRWISVGCLEPQFFRAFLERFLRALPSDVLDQEDWVPTLEGQYQKEDWTKMKSFFERGFKLFDRNHWANIFDGSDACAVPVLSPSEAAVLAAPADTTNGSASHIESIPVPHPRLSRTPARPPPDLGSSTLDILLPGQHTNEILMELGIRQDERKKLALDGALGSLEKEVIQVLGAKL